MIRIGDNRISIIAVGFLIIDILQSFAFALSDNTFYLSSIGWSFNYIILLISICTILYCSEKGKNRIDNSRKLLIISIILYWILTFIHSYGNLSILSALTPIVLIGFVITSDDILESSYILFYWVFTCISAISIVAYICYITGLIRPFAVVPYYEEDSFSEYVSYIFTYILQPIGLPRLCGLYNEPGMFGTIGALVLVAEDMKINRWNIIILIACLLSLSVAFFSLVAAYYFFRAIAQRNIKIIVVLIAIIGIIYYFSSVKILDNDLSLFLERFTIEDGALKGDNRVKGSEGVWESVLNDDWKLLFGYGKYMADGQVTSYRRLIVNHGIIGTALFLIPLFVGIIKYGKKRPDVIILALVFLCSMYQRPEIYNMAYFVVLIGSIARKRREETSKLVIKS